MLFSEFVEATGCRETDYNYKVYRDLEIIYMNTDCSKEKIYEYGRKLVNNEKTEKEKEFEAGIINQINDHKELIKGYKKDIEFYTYLINVEYDETEKKARRKTIKSLRNLIKEEQNIIRSLKWVIA